MFVAGGGFGYYVAFPVALGFLLEWITAANLTPIIDAMEYFDLFFTIIAVGTLPQGGNAWSSESSVNSVPVD